VLLPHFFLQGLRGLPFLDENFQSQGGLAEIEQRFQGSFWFFQVVTKEILVFKTEV
jgi:hypothetical protein